LNSILQCLASVTPLVDYVKSKEFAKRISGIIEKAEEGTTEREKQRGLVAQEFSRLIKKLGSSDEAFEPVDFIEMMQNATSLFIEETHHDSQEFLSWLLDTIHEGLRLYA
jgi:ubiquitin C-terminal hydrolase